MGKPSRPSRKAGWLRIVALFSGGVVSVLSRCSRHLLAATRLCFAARVFTGSGRAQGCKLRCTWKYILGKVTRGHHWRKYSGVVQTRPVRRRKLSPRLFPRPSALCKRSVSSASCVLRRRRRRRRGSETRASCENNGPPRNRTVCGLAMCVALRKRVFFVRRRLCLLPCLAHLPFRRCVPHTLAVALCGSRSKVVGTRRHKTRWGRLRDSGCMWSVGRSALVEFRAVSVWTNQA